MCGIGVEDAEFNYDNIAMEMDGKKECFISVKLEGCSKGNVIEVNTKNGEDKKVPVEDKQTKACLPTMCTADDKLSDEVEIGGETDSIIIEAEPDNFVKGDSKVGKLFELEKDCSSSSEKPVVTVKCVKQEKGM